VNIDLVEKIGLQNKCELSSRRQLRSSGVQTCALQRTTTRLEDRAFAAAGQRLWNSLPAELRQPDLSLGQFRRALKHRRAKNTSRHVPPSCVRRG